METLVFYGHTQRRDKGLQSKHIYIHVCTQYSSILVQAEPSEATWNVSVLQ